MSASLAGRHGCVVISVSALRGGAHAGVGRGCDLPGLFSQESQDAVFGAHCWCVLLGTLTSGTPLIVKAEGGGAPDMGWVRPGTLPAPRGAWDGPTDRNHLVPDASSAEARKPWPAAVTQKMQAWRVAQVPWTGRGAGPYHAHEAGVVQQAGDVEAAHASRLRMRTALVSAAWTRGHAE